LSIEGDQRRTLVVGRSSFVVGHYSREKFMQLDLLSIVLVIIGLALLYGGLFRPRFFWESEKLRQTRALIGDNRSRLLYVVMGVVMLLVGAWGMI
jgi:hypothetical protein